MAREELGMLVSSMEAWGAQWTQSPVELCTNNHLKSLEIVLRTYSKWRFNEKNVLKHRISESLWYLNHDPLCPTPFQLVKMETTPDGCSQKHRAPFTPSSHLKSYGIFPGGTGLQYFSFCPQLPVTKTKFWGSVIKNGSSLFKPCQYSWMRLYYESSTLRLLESTVLLRWQCSSHWSTDLAQSLSESQLASFLEIGKLILKFIW